MSLPLLLKGPVTTAVSIAIAMTPTPSLVRQTGKLILSAPTPVPSLVKSTGKVINSAPTPVPS